MPSNGSSKRTDACLRAGQLALEEAGLNNARREARLLLAHHTGQTPERLMAFPEEPVSDPAAYMAMIGRRAGREPLSHITGKREFWSLDFSVSSAVLDPRPDSETLIEAVLSHIADMEAPLTISDFGTGSGCLLLTLLSELPNARGTAVDVSAEALAMAESNAHALGLGQRCRFVRSDWAEQLDGQYNIIISNPPYIETATVTTLEPEVRDHEPHLALDGGEDGLDAYKALIPQAYSHLKPDGLIALELGIGQAPSVSALLEAGGFSGIRIHCDLSGIERCLTAKR